MLITIAAAAYQQKSAEREKATKVNELKPKDAGQAESIGFSVSATGSDLRIGSVLQVSNSIVNLYESGAAADADQTAGKRSGEGQRENQSHIIWNVPSRLAHFTGREDLIEKMRNDLSATDSPHVCTLFGLGGVGKTSLAIEYAHRFAGHYKLVWWINADEPRSIIQQLARLATRLSLQGPTDNEKLIALIEYLQRNSGWMLIFDNVEDPREISHLMPSGDGNVLITSRRTTFGSLGTTIPVDVLQRADSIAFLRKRRPSVEKEKCGELAETLGDLPLALEQVAAYLDMNQVSLGTYLSLWKIRSQQLLEKGQVVGHEHTIATVWNISVEKIAELNPAAIDLLNISAFLAPSVIPSFLFTFNTELLPARLARAASDELYFSEVLGALASYSMCHYISDGAISALSFHRLVQAATRRKLAEVEAEKASGTALRLLEAEVPPNSRDNQETWPWWYVFLPHVLVAARLGAGFSSNGENVSRLLWGAGVYMHSQGRPNEGIPLLEQALGATSSQGGDASWEFAVILLDLSKCFMDIGDLSRSWDYSMKSMEIVEALPDGSQKIGAFAVHSGFLMREMGRLRESKNFLTAFIERASGSPESNDFLNSAMASLSATLFDLGEFSEAIKLTERVMNTVDPADELDPHLANCLNNLAASLIRLHELDKAEDCLRRSLAIHQAVYGPRHPNTAGVLNNLGTLKREKEEFTDAKEMLETVVGIYEETFGPGSPTTVAAWSNLGAMVRASGDTQGAEIIYRKVLKSMESIHGQVHPNVGKAASNLAVLLSRDGRPAEARPLAIRAVNIAEKAFGYNHIETAIKLASLGTVLLQLGQAREGSKAYRRALAISKKGNNKDDPRAWQLQQELASWEHPD
ncbi:MAG: FxSxx-COOH system tetratricopeptide repeat protein [Trebonia sp.]